MGEEAVWEAEQNLKLAQLQEEYHGVLDALHESPDDEDLKARKAELANEIVAVRVPLREHREAQTAALDDGVARPAPVNTTTGVSE